MIFQNKTYDTLKTIALKWLPALGALYFALAQIWNFPFAEEIVGTITAIDTFLGVILEISTKEYHKRTKAEKEGEDDGNSENDKETDNTDEQNTNGE